MLFSISTVRLPFLHHLTPMSTSSVHIFCSELVQTLPLQIGSSNLSSNFLETFNYWFELKTIPTEHTERWTLPRVLYLSSAVLCQANNGNFLDHIAFSSLPSLQKPTCFPFLLHSSSFVVETIVPRALQKVSLWKAPSPLHVTLLPSCNTSYNKILSTGTVKSLLTSYCQK